MRKGTVGTSVNFTSLSPKNEPSDATLLRQAEREAKQWQAKSEKSLRAEDTDRANRIAQP